MTTFYHLHVSKKQNYKILVRMTTLQQLQENEKQTLVEKKAIEIYSPTTTLRHQTLPIVYNATMDLLLNETTFCKDE
jgi:hypothetical protein